MPHNIPAKAPALGRAAIERVLARAAELQAKSGDDDGDPFTEAQLIDIAKEVGLSADNVRQALAEEGARLELEAESGAAFQLLGTAYVQASRTVPGNATAVLTALDEWMQHAESLQVKRRYPGRLSWEPRQDFVSTIRRALRVGGRGFHMATATEARGLVTSVDGRRSQVALVADFGGTRSLRTVAAAAVVGGSVLFGIPLFLLATQNNFALGAILALLPALVVPAVVISLVRRQYRALLRRASVALEQALDRLEYGDPPRSGR
jgi:hypothetical protein